MGNALKKILLVEDSDTTRLTHRIMITKRTTYSVISVANGVEALKLAPIEKPDLILKQESTLVDAAVDRANLVVITTNNIETALLVTKRTRDRNQKAAIVVRCYLDEFTEILESLGANEVISSSKSAFNEIATHIGSTGAAR
jgi:voltage-gated potassium channel Kch